LYSHNQRNMKKTTLLALAAVISTLLFSQGTLKGKITDSSTAKPLGLATVTVFKAADTAIITYRLSTPDGEFKVPGIPFDVNCRVVISYSGYSVYRKEFIITSSQSTLDIGAIALPPDSKTLDEVLVIAERPPVVIKKDTIEFNASAFKTLPNALVEDLLKKLPGVMVDKEGNIVVNGKPVNRILVDGKTFFGDDPKMATRNLPANVIDKVQVTDDKEELMRNGDDNLNNVGKVINITLKKGVKKGWFGKIYAGGGTNDLYEAGAIANIFRDTLQLSVLGYMNNINRTGFSYSELMSAGGFDRIRSNSASNSTSVWNNNGGNGISICSSLSKCPIQSCTINWIHGAASKLTIVAGLNSVRFISFSLITLGFGVISSSSVGARVYSRGTFLPSLIPEQPIRG